MAFEQKAALVEVLYVPSSIRSDLRSDLSSARSATSRRMSAPNKEN
jgi:hypothetical protein